MNADSAIRSILVAGGGIVGLSAAIAFARGLPRTVVTMLRLPGDPAALADRFGATLPPVARFHAAIGIDEGDLVRRGVATHHLATRFEGWAAGGGSWTHGFGSVGRRSGGIAFHQLWLRAHRADDALAYDRYSAAATLAAAGKFVHPAEDHKSPLATYLYALSLDPGGYSDTLAAVAKRSGVVETKGEISNVGRRDDGGIGSVRLVDGRELEADLFIDCSGPQGALLARLDDDFEEWGQWQPFDRISITTADGGDNVTPLVTVAAHDDGWSSRQGKTQVTMASSSKVTESAEWTRLRPGRRTRPWIANVLAVGDSAVALDPLHGTNLHLAQSAILRALELLPGRDCAAVETAEYNRRTELEVCRVRDFLAIHYHCAGTAGSVWEEFRNARPPDGVARLLDQFEARGRVPFHEEETFAADSWAATLIGLGVLPRCAAATAGAVDLAAVVRGMQNLSSELGDLAARLPPYPAYLARMRAAPPG